MSIEVWKDTWIKNLSNCCLKLLDDQQPTPMKVASFIDFGKRIWNENMVKEVFQPEEALMILNIPLSRYFEPDKWIWSDSKLGLFSIKSTYFKARMILGKYSNPIDERDQLWNVV